MIRKFATWLFWRVYYTFRFRPSSLEAFLRRGMRTRWPWKKFRPSVWHNDDGDEWHVYLTDEQSYTEPRTISLDCHVGMESGNIVGFDVWDERLLAVKAEGGDASMEFISRTPADT